MKSDIDKLERSNNALLSLFFATELENLPSLETDNLEPIHGSLPPRWHEIPKEPSLNKKNQPYTLNEAAEITSCPSRPGELVEAGKNRHSNLWFQSRTNIG